jgi:hypothetical protein
LAVAIKEKIMQNLGQPRLYIGSGIELFVGREGTNKRFLNQILGVRGIFHQVERHPIQMIEVNHSSARDGVLPGASGFLLSQHAGILTNRKASV